MSPSDPICPRCGYSLVGEVASWTTICPRAGRCTECGLAFAWVDVFDPDRQRPRWCVEFARWSRLWWAVPVTWGRSLVPKCFYRRLTIWHEVRGRRLALYLLLLLLGSYVVFTGVQAWSEYDDCVTTRMNPSERVSVTPMEAVLHTIVQPFRSRIIGTYSNLATGSVRPYFTPGMSRWRRGLAMLVAGGLFVTLQPVAFVALPVSRRRARVRWRHLTRVGTYSFGWLFLLFLVVAIDVVVMNSSLFWTRPLWWEGVHHLAPYALLLTLPLTWLAAVRRYLRMRQPMAVTLATSVVALLATLLVLFVWWRDLVAAEMAWW